MPAAESPSVEVSVEAAQTPTTQEASALQTPEKPTELGVASLEGASNPSPAVEAKKPRTATRSTPRPKRVAKTKSKDSPAPTEDQVEGAATDGEAVPGEKQSGCAPPPTTPIKSEGGADAPSSKRRKFVFKAEDSFALADAVSGGDDAPAAVVFEATGSAAMVSLTPPSDKRTSGSKLGSPGKPAHPVTPVRAGTNKGSRSAPPSSWARAEL